MGSETEKSHSKLEWIFYMLILPLLFTGILTVILLTFIGYDVKAIALQWGNTLPVVEKLIPDSPATGKDQPSGPSTEELQMSLAQEREKIKHEQEKQAGLEDELQNKEKQIAALKQEIQALSEEREAVKTEEAQIVKELKEIAKMYGAMTPNKAAPILENLTLDESVQILKAMNLDERSAIIAKMDPVIAAKLTTLLLPQQAE